MVAGVELYYVVRPTGELALRGTVGHVFNPGDIDWAQLIKQRMLDLR